MYAWAEIDSPEGGLTTDAWCEKYGLTRMMTQEELIELAMFCSCSPRATRKSTKNSQTSRCAPASAAMWIKPSRRITSLQSVCLTLPSRAARRAGRPPRCVLEEYQAADKTNIKGVNAWGSDGFEDYAIHQAGADLHDDAGSRDGSHAPDKRRGVHRRSALCGWLHRNAFRLRKGLAVHDEHCALHGKFRTEICSDYFRHFIEALVEFFKNGTIPAPHSETLSIISAWGALMELKRPPGHLGQSPEGLSLSLQKTVTTHASLTAKGFFQKRDYAAIKEQQVERYWCLAHDFCYDKNDIKKIVFLAKQTLWKTIFFYSCENVRLFLRFRRGGVGEFGERAAGTPGTELAMLQYGENRLRYRSNRARSISLWR